MAKIANVQEVDVGKLIPYENNAKQHGRDQIEKLKDSIAEFGFLTPCLIDKDYNLIAGHGRLMAAKELGMRTVPCVFIEGLTEEQRRAYILADNRLGELGDWDMALVNEELIDLAKMGFDASVTGFEFEFSPDSEVPASDNPYTGKVKIPQYEPQGYIVPIADLCDQEKYLGLIHEIDEADIPEDEKEFLRLAAARHLVFNYKNIAEYYCEASAETQRLMEKSALVIIDIGDAIAEGFATLSAGIEEMQSEAKE